MRERRQEGKTEGERGGDGERDGREREGGAE